MNSEKSNTRYFECACHGIHHTLAITHFKCTEEHTPDTMYICMLMDDRINFFKRLWKGLRFAFLRRPIYAEFLIEDSVQVSDIVNTLEEFREFREFSRQRMTYREGKCRENGRK